MHIDLAQPITGNERTAWLAWTTVTEIGPRTLERLLLAFGSLETAWAATSADLAATGLTSTQIKAINECRSCFNQADFMAALDRHAIRPILLPDPDYPPLLREITDPPFVLYQTGALPAAPLLSVVGTRVPTPYGRIMTERIIEGLAPTKTGIVSGLALGIDAFAHTAAIEHNLPTIAVFASGLDRVYPGANEPLAEAILKHGGAWLSEHPPKTDPIRQHFPRRNRIIAGISLGTLVVEAGEKSGALITARYALDANRDVFAVPGPATNLQSAGTNRLIQSGAHLVTSAEDLVAVLGLTGSGATPASQSPEASPDEANLLALLAPGPLDVDRLIEKSRMSSSRVLALCAQLELHGRIRRLDDASYLLIR